MEQRQNELGTAPVGYLLRKLAVPAIAAQLVNVLYNIVDRMYIGNIPEIGKLAMTGLGVAMPIIMIMSAFASLVGMGGAPLAAIRLGAKDQEGAEKIIGNCATMLSIVGALLMVVIFCFKRPILLAFGASADTIGYAETYLTVYTIGTLFVMGTLGLNAFITTQGQAGIAMKTVLIGAICNIVLDPVFIFVFHMDVAGAAWATILSQAISFAWVLRFLFSERNAIPIRKPFLRIEARRAGQILALGLSPFIMQATESLVQITPVSYTHLDVYKRQPPDVITYDDFMKVDLRTAKVLSCEPVKGADRLLVFRLDDGERERTIVSGIRKWYGEGESLVGKTVIIVANLKPTKIRGIVSEGMILSAADDADENLSVSTVLDDTHLPAGVRVR